VILGAPRHEATAAPASEMGAMTAMRRIWPTSGPQGKQ
jgi:hypothetical protein